MVAYIISELVTIRLVVDVVLLFPRVTAWVTTEELLMTIIKKLKLTSLIFSKRVVLLLAKWEVVMVSV